MPYRQFIGKMEGIARDERGRAVIEVRDASMIYVNDVAWVDGDLMRVSWAHFPEGGKHTVGVVPYDGPGVWDKAGLWKKVS